VDQYLYQIRPTRVEMLSQGPDERESRLVAEHFEYLRRLTEEGVVLMAGRTLDSDARAFGIVVFTAKSHEAARELMGRDPAVAQGVMQAELFPFRMGLWSRRATA